MLEYRGTRYSALSLTHHIQPHTLKVPQDKVFFFAFHAAFAFGGLTIGLSFLATKLGAILQVCRNCE